MRRLIPVLSAALVLASACKHEEVKPANLPSNLQGLPQAFTCNATGNVKIDLTQNVRTHLAWKDEFNGPVDDTDDSSCFTRAPICGIQGYDNVSECTGYDPGKLALLNKCKWWVYKGPNYMPGIPTHNQFDPKYVEVSNGHLILSSEILSTQTAGIKCNYESGEYSGCPMASGAIMTRPVPGVRGFNFEGGYMEMKARYDTGDHGWPAFWILANEAWPRFGEIDIMESYAKDRNLNMAMTLHDVPIEERTNPPAGGKWTHIQTGADFWLDTTQDATYGVYWDKGDAHRLPAVWYVVNDCIIGKTEYGQKVHSGGKDYQIGVPNEGKLFYAMLNLSMSLNGGLTAVGPGREKMIVDYVRYYDH